MSPQFSAPPLSLVLHLWPALRPSPPPPLLPVITQEKLLMCTCELHGCSVSMPIWDVICLAEGRGRFCPPKSAALPVTVFLAEELRSKILFSPLRSPEKKCRHNSGRLLGKMIEWCFYHFCSKICIEFTDFTFKLLHYICLVFCSSMTLQFSWIAEKSNILLTDIEKL